MPEFDVQQIRRIFSSSEAKTSPDKLINVIPRIPDVLLPQTVESALDLSIDSKSKSRIIAVLAARLKPENGTQIERRLAAIRTSLLTSYHIKNRGDPDLLRVLAPVIPIHLIPQILELAIRTHGGIDAIGQLLRRLPAANRHLILQNTFDVMNVEKAGIFDVSSKYLYEKRKENLKQIQSEFQNGERSEASLLPQEQQPSIAAEFLKTSSEINSESQVTLFRKLVSFLTTPSGEQGFRNKLTEIRSYKFYDLQGYICELGILLPVFSDNIWQDQSLIEQFSDHPVLLPPLSMEREPYLRSIWLQSELAQVMESTATISEDKDQYKLARWLHDLSAFLCAPLLLKALEITHRIELRGYKAHAASAIFATMARLEKFPAEYTREQLLHEAFIEAFLDSLSRTALAGGPGSLEHFAAFRSVEHGPVKMKKAEPPQTPPFIAEEESRTGAVIKQNVPIMDDYLPPPTAPSRYVNVCITSLENQIPVKPDFSLTADKEYFLRIDIGLLSRDSVVSNNVPFADQYLPHTTINGHWLDVAVVSSEFVIPPRLYHLFLPDIGPSWVCNCVPGGEHSCQEHERKKYLFVQIRTPAKPGKAALRICLYYANNAVQSQILIADIAQKEEAGGGQYSSLIDYTLTSQLKDVSFLPARSLNILTNENGDGSHTFVFKNGIDEEVLSFRLTEGQMGGAIDVARATLLSIHAKENGDKSGKRFFRCRRRRLKNLYDDNNSKLKKDFIDDLRSLAHVGWDLWTSISINNPEEGRRLISFQELSNMKIQVARVQSSVFVFPWALIYDIPLATDRTKDKNCKILDDWEQNVDQLEGFIQCPYQANHQEGTICPFGFWGFRHKIEQLPSTQRKSPGHPERKLPLKIHAKNPLEIVVCSSLDLDPELTKSHMRDVEGHLAEFKVIQVNSADDIRKALSKPDIEIVYFYCHGLREQLPGAKDTKPYLQVGKGDQIFPSDVSAWYTAWAKTDLEHWKTTPLVIINGCHTAEITPASLVNFVDAFMFATAGGVIGTEITIEQRVANEAAAQFLLHFGKQQPVGEALRLMRINFLKKNNLLGLAYTAYCSADLQIVKDQN